MSEPETQVNRENPEGGVILVPWEPATAGLPDLTGTGFEYVVWTMEDAVGESARPPARPEEVVFAVAPYTFDRRAHAPMRDSMPRLRVLQVLMAGFEHAVPFLAPGVGLCNARGVHDASTAELAVGMILASQRGIDASARAMVEHEWLRFTTRSLADSTVLIVGFGSIGRALAARLQGFECEVIPVASTARVDSEYGQVHSVDELPQLLTGADVVVLLTPLTEHTRHLIGERELALMRPGALLVNMARGPVVDTGALVHACAQGRVRAALDVTDPEPLPAEHPLWSAPGVLITAHRGGLSAAFEPRAYRLVSEQIQRLISGKELQNCVIPPGLPDAHPVESFRVEG